MKHSSLTLPVQTFPAISMMNLLGDYQNEFSTLGSIVVCWAQLTINSRRRSEVRAHIRTEPPTLSREHFLWPSACCSQWEVSHQGSKVRTGVWIKLISFSCTDSKNCRLSLWKGSIFTLQTWIMSFMWPLTDRLKTIFHCNPEHLSPTLHLQPLGSVGTEPLKLIGTCARLL